MIKKFGNYETTKAYGEFEQLPRGAYVLEILNAEGDCFTIGPCFGAHNVLYSMGGAFQPDPGRFTIDLTAYTPGTHTLRIETRRRFPTVIPVT